MLLEVLLHADFLPSQASSWLCALSGSLPDAWGANLGNLTSLDLRNNSLSGPLPASWGQQMQLLENLDLSMNALTDSIPVGALRSPGLDNNCFSPAAAGHASRSAVLHSYAWEP